MIFPTDNSRATMLLGHVRKHLHDVGATVTYAELRDMWELPDDQDLVATASKVVADVNKRLHRSGDHRNLVNVVNEGYRIASPAELREVALGRHRHIERQYLTAQREMEQVVRHPEATVAERKRAADAVQQQAALSSAARTSHRRLRFAWPAEERSPVPVDLGPDA